MFTFSFAFTALPSFEIFDGFNLVHGEGFVGAGHHCWRFLLVLFQIQNNLLFLSLRLHTLNAWRCQRSTVKKISNILRSWCLFLCIVKSSRCSHLQCLVCFTIWQIMLHGIEERVATPCENIAAWYCVYVCVCVSMSQCFFRTPTKKMMLYIYTYRNVSNGCWKVTLPTCGQTQQQLREESEKRKNQKRKS